MYIIACRAHFCHLLGQGKPVGVLVLWTGAQCGQAPNPPAMSNAPLHPQWLPMPLTSLHPYAPLDVTYTPASPSTYTPCQLPNAPLTPLHPLGAP